MFKPIHLLLLLLIATTNNNNVRASRGDTSNDYYNCISYCLFSRMFASSQNKQSDQFFFSSKISATWPIDHCQLPFHLSLTRWTCQEDCQYRCMHAHAHYHGVIYQYYGKWPFYRLLGCQEPLSTLFSLGNLVQHVRGIRMYTVRTNSQYQQCCHHSSKRQWSDARFYVLVYGMTSILLWIASATFHTRDLWITERLDYLCAALASLVSLQWTLVRLAGHLLKSTWFALFLTLVFARHAYWLLAFTKFSYSYNMTFNIAVAATFCCIWMIWGFYTLSIYSSHDHNPPKSPRPHLSQNHVRTSHAKLALTMMAGITLFMLLEVLDFPPVFRVLDAHALWHLSTIPLIPIWWQFLTEDAEYWFAELCTNQPRMSLVQAAKSEQSGVFATSSSTKYD